MILPYMYHPYRLILCLVGWGMITWPLGWSDPSIGCTWSISSLPCLLHIYLDIFSINLFFALVDFSLGCLNLFWTIPADMSSLQATEIGSLVQPSVVVSLEVCSNAVLRYMSIFLTIVTTFPSVVVPIVMVCIVFSSYMLIWCPHRLWSTLKGSMSILLAIVVVTIKSVCPCDSRPAVLCHMSLHVALMTIPLTFRCIVLIGPFTPTNISSMSFLITVMTSGFWVLTFVTPLFKILWCFTFFSIGESKSWCNVVWSWWFHQLLIMLDSFTWIIEVLC